MIHQQPKKTLLQLPDLWLPDREPHHPWHLPSRSSRGLARRCCCGDCTQFSDNFNRANSSDIGSDWSEESGNWSISSNKLVAAAAGAIATTQVSLTLPYVIFVTARATSASDEAKVIWNYVDTDNYTYLHVTFDSSSRWRIFKRVAGVETSLDFVNVSDANVDTDLFIAVCVKSSSTIVAFSLSSSESSYETILATGRDTAQTECGLGVTTQAGSITFDDFRVDHHGATQSGCFICDFPCDHCIDGIAPVEWQVVITGMAGPNDCANFDGTWILHPTNTICLWSTGDLNFESDPICSGFANISLRLEDAVDNPFKCDDPPTHNHAIQIRCGYGATSICTDLGCSSLFRHTQVATYDCLAISGLDIPDHAHELACDSTGATCTLTAL